MLILSLVSSLLLVNTMIGCKTPDQKVDDAQSKVDDAKENLEKVEVKAAVSEMKAANAEEWKIFKNESEAKIKTNDIRIKELKSKIKSADFVMEDIYEKRVDSLELQNKKLQTRVDNYSKTMTDWETFKREFNNDMEGLGKALKEFTIKKK